MKPVSFGGERTKIVYGVVIGAVLYVLYVLAEFAGTLSPSHYSLFAGPDTSREEALVSEATVYVFLALPGLIAMVAWGVVMYRRQQRFQQTLEDDPRAPAFDVSLVGIESFDVGTLATLRGRVAKMVIMRNTYSVQQDAYGGVRSTTRYASFVVDINGVSHDVREHEHHHVVAEHAAILAQALGCPLDDASYG